MCLVLIRMSFLYSQRQLQLKHPTSINVMSFCAEFCTQFCPCSTTHMIMIFIPRKFHNRRLFDILFLMSVIYQACPQETLMLPFQLDSLRKCKIELQDQVVLLTICRSPSTLPVLVYIHYDTTVPPPSNILPVQTTIQDGLNLIRTIDTSVQRQNQ